MREYAGFFNQDRVSLTGTLRLEHLPDVLRLIRQVTHVARYPRLKLDLGRVESAYGSFLVTLLAHLKYLQANRIDVEVTLPSSAMARNFMDRLNWTSILDDTHKNRRAFRPDKAVPIFHFTDPDEQGHTVACTTKALLFQIADLDRRQLQAAQWAISEITDNVLNHANSLVGGFSHCQINHQLKLIEFVVADAGIGIARSLNEPDHGLALEKSITEGVTRNKQTNQGNGLYGTWRLATLSKGIFAIHSQRGKMFVRKEGSVKVDSKSDIYPGTYVLFQIDYSDPNLIAEALTFKGSLHVPGFDYIEQHFESDGVPHTSIRLADHVASTGSRDSGRKLANLINNVIKMSEDNKVDIDFADILVVSSSFADECFGRLIARMGPAEFFSKITFVNADAAIRAIIDRSVLQRLRIQSAE